MNLHCLLNKVIFYKILCIFLVHNKIQKSVYIMDSKISHDSQNDTITQSDSKSSVNFALDEK